MYQESHFIFCSGSLSDVVRIVLGPVSTVREYTSGPPKFYEICRFIKKQRVLVCGSSLLPNKAWLNYEGDDGIVVEPDNSQQADGP